MDAPPGEPQHTPPPPPPVTPVPPALPSGPGAGEWSHDPAPVLVAEGVGRFRSPQAAEPIPPSLALASPREPIGPVPESFGPRPRFARRNGRHVVRVETAAGTSLYGTGEVAGPLLRNGRRTVCWNTDSFQYDEATESLYQSHPWVLGLRADGTAFGVLTDTTWRCEVDLRDGIEFRAEGVAPAVYVVEGPSPQRVVERLAALTGRTPLPPRWALGYHQCRWSYHDEQRVRDLAAEFRSRRIPCDAIWLDIDYMRGFRCFTFDPQRFPDPGALNDDLHAQGFRTVWMIDPGIKVDPEYRVYAAGRSGDHFVQDAAGGEFHGSVWPGPCAFPDFTREATRAWWADLYRDFMARGIDGVWNDMNEPSVFSGPNKTMPEENRHRADASLGGPDAHARYHNVYGMLMVRASREGIERARPGERPFILTRANFIGGHRYAATWTGDNVSDWKHLAWSVPMVLNMGLSGQPFVGPDIGGFAGNAEADLFARWMGIGALLPFARGHTITESAPHEPWAFGPDAEAACRLALERRSRLVPYLYTLFHEAATTGLPVARPLFFADPADPALRGADDAFLLGADLLVRCCVEPSPVCHAATPRGIWQRVEITERAHPALPELRVRGGAIVPLGPVAQFDGEKPLDPLTLLVCLDERGEARGTLYEDAGQGLAHERGDFLLTTYAASLRGDHAVVEVAGVRGERPRPRRALHALVILTDGRTVAGIGQDGRTLTIPLEGAAPGAAPRPQAPGAGVPAPAAAPATATAPIAAPPGVSAEPAMMTPFSGPLDLARITGAQTRSISAENPDGRRGGGAQAVPGPDPQLSAAASELGKGWKVRPCLKNFEPGQRVVIADIEGPGVVQHIWCTVLHDVHRWVALRVYYDDAAEPSIQAPLGDFFANGLDGAALVNSIPVAVNPKGGMNAYWPMPFRKRIRIEVSNDGPARINEFFYQVSYALQPVPDDAGYLHASWRRGLTSRERPEHVILDGARGRGHYVGTYLAWTQLSNGWWGEGEVKFFIDGDEPGAPTIVGTGTEDYFGGAWGFVMDHAADLRPTTYSTAYLGYPQAIYGATPKRGPIVPAHGLYRWHIPDPIRFQRSLRVSIQALGWWPTGKYQPLTDDIASTAFWYQSPAAGVEPLPPLNDRLAR